MAKVPSTRMRRSGDEHVVRVTGKRAGTDEVVTIQMTINQWLELSAVQLVVEIEVDRYFGPLSPGT